MDPLNNPFRPGAGKRPPTLAGRQRELDEYDVMCERCERFGEGSRPWVLQGLRGVGKTALLTEFLSRAERRGWITCQVEAGSEPLASLIAQGLYRSLRQAVGRQPRESLKRLLAFFKTFSMAVDPQGQYRFGVELGNATDEASGNLTHDLKLLFEFLGETARDRGIGVLLLIDEMQEATGQDLNALNIAAHAMGQGEVPVPVILIGAGLPSLPAVLADATSYAGRLYEYRSIGRLTDADAADAYVVPAQARGVEWTSKALELALDSARGYPFFLQLCGKQIWDFATGSPISLEDAEIGTQRASSELDASLYLSRWERATRAQQNLLRAIAGVGEDASVQVAELPAKLGKKRVSDLSVARTELIKKGLLFVPSRGTLKFTVPGMADFINRQP